MKILQIGVAKSGNYWVYKTIQTILQNQGLPNHSFIQNEPIYPVAQTWPLSHDEQAGIDVLDIEAERCFYRISNIFRMPILDLDAYLSRCSHVWSHSSYVDQAQTVLPKFDKVVYIVRDPRDVALSMARFVFTPYMQTFRPVRATTQKDYLQNHLDGLVRLWVSHVAAYLLQADSLNIHFLFYERLLTDFDNELAALLTYCDIRPSVELINHVKHTVDFQTMQAQNPEHVRRGKMNQWLHKLSAQQQQTAWQIAGPLLTLLNYPETAVSNDLPRYPTTVASEAVQAALAVANKRPFLSRAKQWASKQINKRRNL